MTKPPTTAETLEPELPLTVYHRLSRRDASLKDALEHTIGSVIAHRWHILQTFKRDFTSQSNLTRGGALWNYILPLVPLGAYVLLMAMRLFPSFGAVNAVVYITFGVTLYFLFSGLVRIPITVLEGQFSSLSKSNTPIISATIASVSQLMFETLIRSALVIVVFIAFQGAPSWHVIFIIPLLPCAMLLFFSLGIILAQFNLAYRDVAKIVSIVLTYGLFFSNVIFPMGNGPVITQILSFNPFYIFIENCRGLAIGAPLVHVNSLIGFGCLSVMIFLIAVRLTYRAELRLRGWV
tara:strand:+ start:1290 stop:2168 length:879 start_codon:yes stop_codon:yes gene_type:complete